MRESANYKFNLPDKADQFNLDHWNQNTEKLDKKLKSIDDKDVELNNLINNKFNDLLNGNSSDTESLYYKIMLKAHPVGSLYWSSNPTDPSTLFGGTWKQIKDRFVLACGDTYANGATGGSSTVTLTVNQIPSHTHTGPSHTHSFTPRGSVSSHSHTINSGNTSSSGIVTTAGIRHSGSTGGMSGNSSGDAHGYTRIANEYDLNNACTGVFSGSYVAQHSIGGRDSVKSIYNLHINISHTHTLPTSYIYGKTDNTAPTFTGTEGTTGASGTGNTGATGGGKSHDNMPPYVVKYCWERTA